MQHVLEISFQLVDPPFLSPPVPARLPLKWIFHSSCVRLSREREREAVDQIRFLFSRFNGSAFASLTKDVPPISSFVSLILMRMIHSTVNFQSVDPPWQPARLLRLVPHSRCGRLRHETCNLLHAFHPLCCSPIAHRPPF